ncbi:hypothetical protein AAG570_009708 [Ranatra chinensis]|uniref:Uncharacterized protein n=1 Tax=Ranatra chinensis TaxID=642074 RepID=A0ABD0Z701_9HEMI
MCMVPPLVTEIVGRERDDPDFDSSGRIKISDVGSDPKKISGFGKTLALSQSCHSQCGSGGCYGAKSYHCVRCLNFKLSNWMQNHLENAKSIGSETSRNFSFRGPFRKKVTGKKDGILHAPISVRIACFRRCVQKCPIIGYYPTFDGNQGTGVCVKCHESCLSCSGPGPDECLICRKNFFNTSDLSLCINHCPPSYYQDVLNARCVSCSDNCSTCHRGPDICSSCPPHFALFKGKCIESCPSGTYRNHFNRCIDCFGRNCIPVTGDIKLGDVFSNRLQFNYTGDLYEPRAKALGGNRHQPECNPRVSNECKACWSGCEDCNGTGRFDCLACIPGLTLNELNECVSTCPRNTYPSNVTSSIGPAAVHRTVRSALWADTWSSRPDCVWLVTLTASHVPAQDDARPATDEEKLANAPTKLDLVRPA